MYQDVSSVDQTELVERYSYLVKRIAHHLSARLPASVQVDDLTQAGLLGLLESARNYDSSKGASFETYAGIRIRGAMIDEVRRGDWAPRSVHRNQRAIASAINAVEKRSGRDASDADVAHELGVDLPEYHAMLNDSVTTRLFSVEELCSDEEGPGEQLISNDPDPAELTASSRLREQMAKAIEMLPERERLVLALYYDEEMNLKEIGLVLGVSESRVSQIHSQAAMRLRARLMDWGKQGATPSSKARR